MTWCGKVGEISEERPTILLLLPDPLKDKVHEVGIGAEEEGVPIAWDILDSDAKTLAWEAANRSRLRVGIGISPNECALTLANLDPEEPLIFMEDSSVPLRWLGQAAARFVKGLPLPPTNGERVLVEDDLDEGKIAEVVTRILQQMGLT